MSVVLATHVDDATDQVVARAAEAMQARLDAPQDLLRGLEAAGDEVELVVIGAGVDEPVRMAQRIFVVAPRTPVLILAPSERVGAVCSAIQFAPYVADDVRCLPADDMGVVELAVRETLERARNARAYRRTLSALNERLEDATPIAQPAVLGGILDNAPIGVAVLGAGGCIRAWNRKATELLGYSEREVLGDSFEHLLSEPTRERWRQMLASLKQPDTEAATDVFERQRDGQAQHLEVIAARLRTLPETHLLLLQDVSERESLLSDLQQAVEARDDFLAIAAHELRTPLTSVGLNVQSLKRHLGDAAPGQLPARVAAIERGVARLARLVEALLDVTRINAGRITVHRGVADLTAIAEGLVERMQDEARAAGCSLTLRAPGPVPGHWDALRLDQVLTNLLANALKFGAGKPIEIEVTSTPDTATLTVSDHGPGMSDEQKERLFQRFERGVSDRHYGGLGLGLWITRRLVEAHGGTISVDSRPGGGSRFVVVLPRDGA